jgi:HD-like signal output (HDOD) protein/GGDEF domain-containing protein
MPTTVNTLSFFVHRTRQVYTLPAVALEVLELTAHPRVDCRKLKACIEHDPALVGKILRVVNSSLFGLNREVRDLHQALALLGIKPLKLLVLGFSLSDVVFTGRTGEAMQYAWRHTLTRAVAAKELCEAVWRIPGEEAFTAALLAGLGKFILLDELGEPYANLLAGAVNERDNLSRLEQASLGFDHTQLSVELLSHWNLPETLVNAVRLSARPGQYDTLDPPDKLLPAAVRMGGLLADLMVDGRHECLRELIFDPFEQLIFGQPCSEHQKLRLTESGLEELVDRVQERVGSLAGALKFDLPAGKDYKDVLVAAHEQLALLATEASCAVARQWPLVEDKGTEVAELSAALACYVNRFADTADPLQRRQPSEKRTRTAGAETLLKPIEVRPVRQDEGTLEQSRPLRTVAVTEPTADAKLLDRLATVVGICRQSRCPLSLVLLELDRFEHLVKAHGPEAAHQTALQLHASAGATDHPGAVCLRLGETKLALVIANCDRLAAVSLGQQLLRGLCPAPGIELAAPGTPTLSVGVATLTLASKNFPPADLLKSANRCLSAAQLSGGNTLKSIDVY